MSQRCMKTEWSQWMIFHTWCQGSEFPAALWHCWLACKNTYVTYTQTFSSRTSTAANLGLPGKLVLKLRWQHMCEMVLKFTGNTHTSILLPFFRDHQGEPVPEEIKNFFWTFMVQRKITAADTPTIQMGATPSILISGPPPSSPHFYTRCPSCRNPPTLSWLGIGTKYAGLHTR